MSQSTKIDFLYLSEQDMVKAGVTDMPACVDVMEEMFELLHRGDYRMAGPDNNSHGAPLFFPDEPEHPNMPANGPDRRLMAMPAYLGGSFGTCGMKWYGSNIANKELGLPRSILMFILTDVVTSAPLALMSANLLSAYRTGAIPGVGARHLARQDSKVAAILGPGVMGKTTLAAFIAACPGIDTLKLKSRGAASRDDFLQWVAENYPQITTIEHVDTVEALVRDSDLISYCSSGDEGDPETYPRIKKAWAKPGAFFAMPSFATADDDALQGDVRLVCDAISIYDAWAEELPSPAHAICPMVGVQFMDLIAEGRLERDALEDLGAIVAGDTPGRQNDEEIIVLSVGGMPVEDVAWATHIYRTALEKDIGVSLNLWDQPVLS
ncbi:MAG: tyramine oxidase subunit B [Pseudomonadota bacterium]